MSSEPKKRDSIIRKFSSQLLLFPALMFLIFFGVSILSLLMISFYRFVPVTLWDPTFTLENYITYLSDPFYLNYIWITLKISAECTLIALVMSYPVAYYLARMKTTFLKSALFTLIVVSNFTNVIVRMYSWLIILQEGGVINDMLLTIGIISHPLKLTYNELGVIIGMVNWVLPFTIFSLVGSIQNINPEVELAAQSLGADKLVTFLKITLPLSIPGILAAVLITFSTGEFCISPVCSLIILKI